MNSQRWHNQRRVSWGRSLQSPWVCWGASQWSVQCWTPSPPPCTSPTTYNTRVLKDKNSSQSLHSRTLSLALKEGFTAKTRPLNNAGTMWSVSSHMPSECWVSRLATHLYARRARWHLWQVINQIGLQVLDKRIWERPAMETLESLDSVIAMGDHLCFNRNKKHEYILHDHKNEDCMKILENRS